MKIISLNTWGGRLYPEFEAFLKSYVDTDIFCFQEINTTTKEKLNLDPEEQSDLFEKLEQILQNHKGFFSPQVPGTGHAIFVKKEFTVTSCNKYVLLKSEENPITHHTPYPRIVQVLTLEEPGLTIFNFHGAPGMEKRDTDFRDLQTTRLLEKIQQVDGCKVLMGDFNMRPDIKSIQKIGNEMRNLLDTNIWKTTRSNHYHKIDQQPYADYMFISGEAKVNDFQVLQDEVSDHLPLYIDFEPK